MNLLIRDGQGGIGRKSPLAKNRRKIPPLERKIVAQKRGETVPPRILKVFGKIGILGFNSNNLGKLRSIKRYLSANNALFSFKTLFLTIFGLYCVIQNYFLMTKYPPSRGAWPSLMLIVFKFYVHKLLLRKTNLNEWFKWKLRFKSDINPIMKSN